MTVADPWADVPLPPEPPADERPVTPPKARVRDRFPLVDWDKLWEDDDEEEWILEPLLPARRLIACYSAPKLGKSLLWLEIAVALSLGAEVLGTKPARPFRVLYVDFENDPRGDIKERLHAMGYGPRDLGNLCYLSFPTMAALDSERGSVELLDVLAEYSCEVVVIDTVSRAVQGEENENDTWLAFYRHTGLKLKQRGVAMIRLDHTGKDELKGQRGASAKSGDIDAVWRLSKVSDDTFRLECELNRMPVAEKVLVIKRIVAPLLRHKVEGDGRAAAFAARVESVVELLDELSVPPDATNAVVRGALRSNRLKAGNDAIAKAVQIRRNPFRGRPGTLPGFERSDAVPEQEGTRHE